MLSKKNFDKILVIENKSHFIHVNSNPRIYKNHYKILWNPINFSLEKISNQFIFSDKFLKRNYKNNCDINYEYKFNVFLNKIDNLIKKKLNFFPNNINIFSNARHEFKNLFDYYYNNFAKISYLIKEKKVKEILYFSDSNSKNKFSHEISCALSFLNKQKVKVKEKIIKNDPDDDIYFVNKKDFIPKFFFISHNFIPFIKSKIKNFLINDFSFFKKKILIINCNKVLINILKELKLSAQFYNIQNFSFSKKKLKINIIQHNQICKEVKKITKNLPFYKKNHPFLINDFFYDFIINFYPKLFSNAYFIYKNIKKLDKKYNFESCISTSENFESNIIHDYLTNNKKKFLALSHGGTIGHYKNNPRLCFGNLKTNKFSNYQAFSKNIGNEIKNVIQKFYKSKKYNLVQIPHLYFNEIKKNLKHNNSKGKNIVYFASPLNGQFDCKFEIHSEFNILNIRNNFFKNLKGKNIMLRLGHKSDLNKKFKKYVRKKYKNVTIINDDIPIEKVFELADFIICEGNSTTLIEALFTKKPIIVFKRFFPNFTQSSYQLLKKRVIFIDKMKGVKNLIKNFDSFSRQKLSKVNLNNKDFLNFYYDYKNINKINIVNKIKNFLASTENKGINKLNIYK